MIIIIFTRPFTCTALCSSFGRSTETPAVSPRCPGYDAFWALLGRMLRVQGAMAPAWPTARRVFSEIKGNSSDLWFILVVFLVVF